MAWIDDGKHDRDGLENHRQRQYVEDLIESAKEKKKKIDPAVRAQSDKVFDMTAEIVRKKAVHDKAKYLRIREAFEQNYRKLHPQ